VKTLTASEFKARCLGVLDEVARTGEVVVITKRGREVARLVGPAASQHAHPQDALVGTVTFVGDVVGPAVPAGEWDAVAEPSGEREAPSP
jgi:prevent-host-death family protein